MDSGAIVCRVHENMGIHLRGQLLTWLLIATPTNEADSTDTMIDDGTEKIAYDCGSTEHMKL